MRFRLAALLLLAAPAIAMAVAARSVPPTGPPNTQKPGAWFVVDRQADAAMAGLTTWAVGFPGQLPHLLQRGELKLPPGHPLNRVPYTFVVELTLAPTGRIARARILRGLDTATLRAAFADDLKDWLYTPAMLDGKAVSVYQVVTIPTRLAATGRSPSPPASPPR
jgi:hypothetical protein